MPESLANEFISDFYTSLLHLSGVKLENKLNRVFDGAGNSTGLALSGDRVIINNYVYPVGYASPVEWLDAFWPVGSIKLTFNDFIKSTSFLIPSYLPLDTIVLAPFFIACVMNLFPSKLLPIIAKKI